MPPPASPSESPPQIGYQTPSPKRVRLATASVIVAILAAIAQVAGIMVQRDWRGVGTAMGWRNANYAIDLLRIPLPFIAMGFCLTTYVLFCVHDWKPRGKGRMFIAIAIAAVDLMLLFGYR